MFLTGDRYQKIEDLFIDKTCYIKSKSGKSKTQALYIPLGINVLTFKSVKETATRYGQPMFVFEFYKNPDSRNDRLNKMRYKSIFCYHIVGGGDDNWRELWYKNFTTTMSYRQLSKFRNMTSKKMKAIIKQHEHLVKDDSGELQYNRNGKAYWIEPEIMSVHKTDEQVELTTQDYLSLFVYDKS
jgi:hypothetical protein